MTPPIPTREPTSLAAGETSQWTRTFADYRSADGWSLVYYFAGPDTFQVTASVDSSGNFLATIASSDTKDKPAGTYRWRAYAESGSEQAGTLQRFEVDRGALELEANFATAAGADQQLFAEQMVSALEARIAGRASADLEQYGIAGRTVQKIPFKELHTYLGIWKAKLWRAQNPGQSFPQHAVRFVSDRDRANDWPGGWPGGVL